MIHRNKLSALILLSLLAGCTDGSMVYIHPDSDTEFTQPPEDTCDNECMPNTKSCVDENTVAACTKTEDGCYTFKEITCPNDNICKNGACVDDQGQQSCKDECKPDESKCISEKKLQTCELGEDGCYQFQQLSCANETTCKEGKCIKEQTGPACKDECKADEVSCISEQQFQTCERDENGCYRPKTTTCTSGNVCLDGKCVPKTPDKCQDQCAPNDAECVSDDRYKSCVANEDGCYVFVTTKCQNGSTCKNAKCIEIEPPCHDECQAGSKSCTSDGKTMVCGDFNNDGCLENNVAPCQENEHCNNGICEGNTPPPETCTNECSKSGATECSGTTGVKTCGNYDADSCLEWSPVTACKSGTTCKSGKCSCTNQCETNGKTECDTASNGVKTCADTNGDGCLEWSSVTPCTNMACQNGACVCEHKCNANAKECSGNGYRTCTTNAQNCRIWSKVTSCPNGCENGTCKPEVVEKPTRYPGNQILSPVTAYSVKQMKAIAAKQSRSNVHFAKLGDSHFAPGTVFMYCFASNKSHNLNGATFLENSISAFQSKSPNSFSRDSVSAVIGKTAWWAVKEGKISAELSAMNPRFAFFDYGSNDIGWYDYYRPEGNINQGYFSTLQWYYREYRKALNIMLGSGVIPLLLGTGVQNVTSYNGRTLGYLNPFYFVPVFDAVARGLAEQYQIPYLNLAYLQMQEPLKSNNYGLSSDNLHHRDYNGGCDFTTTGMKYGANARNRYSLEMLDRAYRTVVQNEAAPDAPILFEGAGTKASPYVISSLPYTHAGDTSKGTNNISTYSSCASTSEAGPEIYYKLTLSKATKIRAFAVSAQGADVDIHMLKSIDANGCLARGDVWVEGNLAAGTYYFSIDTYSTSSNAGEYLFGIVECMSGDGLCGTKNTGG